MSQMNIAYKLAEAEATERPRGASRWRSELPKTLLSWVLPLGILIAWSVATKREWVPPQILPAPSAVSATLLEQLRSGDLFMHVGISMGRVAGGFALGGLLGLGLGVAMG